MCSRVWIGREEDPMRDRAACLCANRQGGVGIGRTCLHMLTLRVLDVCSPGGSPASL